MDDEPPETITDDLRVAQQRSKERTIPLADLKEVRLPMISSDPGESDPYSVEIQRCAERELRSLPVDACDDAFALMEELARDPRPAGHVVLHRINRIYRLRFGGEAYRMIYRVDDRKRKVTIIRPRATAYRGYPAP